MTSGMLSTVRQFYTCRWLADRARVVFSHNLRAFRLNLSRLATAQSLRRVDPVRKRLRGASSTLQVEPSRTRRDVGIRRRPRSGGGDAVVVVDGVDKVELTVGVVGRQRAPQHVEHMQGVVERKLPLQLEQQPAVAEEEAVRMRLTQVLEELRLVVLQQEREVRELRRHRLAIRQEVALQPAHQAAEAHVRVRLVVLRDEQRRRDVAHALAVRHVRVRERERDEHVEQRLEVGVVVGAGVERVGTVRPPHVLLHHQRDAEHLVRRVAVQERLAPLLAQPVVLGRLHAQVLEAHAPVQPLRVDVEQVPPDDLAQRRLDAAAVHAQAELFRLTEVADGVEERVELGVRHRGLHRRRLVHLDRSVL